MAPPPKLPPPPPCLVSEVYSSSPKVSEQSQHGEQTVKSQARPDLEHIDVDSIELEWRRPCYSEYMQVPDARICQCNQMRQFPEMGHVYNGLQPWLTDLHTTAERAWGEELFDLLANGRLFLDEVGNPPIIWERESSQDSFTWNTLNRPSETHGMLCFLDGLQPPVSLLYCMVTEPVVPQFHEVVPGSQEKQKSGPGESTTAQREPVQLIEQRPLSMEDEAASAEERESEEALDEEDDFETSSTIEAQLNTSLSEEPEIEQASAGEENSETSPSEEAESEQSSNKESDIESALEKRVPQGICKRHVTRDSRLNLRCYDGVLRCSDGECPREGHPCRCDTDPHNEALMRIRQQLEIKALATQKAADRAKRLQMKQQRAAVKAQVVRPVGTCKNGGRMGAGIDTSRLRRQKPRLQCIYRGFTCSSRPCPILGWDCECEYDPWLKSR
ncbi:hypothetical protein MMC10_001525 [Thelotrema lepadinum]|nr:hypothetical protein [Thelotrema lepadinum]